VGLPPGCRTRAQMQSSMFTDWSEFATMIYALARTTRGRMLIDMRNLISARAANDEGLRYVGVGA
jgi:hypothetical protein